MGCDKSLPFIAPLIWMCFPYLMAFHTSSTSFLFCFSLYLSFFFFFLGIKVHIISSFFVCVLNKRQLSAMSLALPLFIYTTKNLEIEIAGWSNSFRIEFFMRSKQAEAFIYSSTSSSSSSMVLSPFFGATFKPNTAQNCLHSISFHSIE